MPFREGSTGFDTSQLSTIRKVRIRYSLAVKILVLLLGLATVTSLCTAGLAFVQMRAIGEHAREGTTTLGKFAVKNSSSALIAAAEEDLQSRVLGLAERCDGVFRRIEIEARQLASVASRVWSNPAYNVPRPAHLSDQPPANIRDRSSYVLAPGVQLSAVQNEFNLSAELDNLFMATCANEPVLLAAHIATAGGMLRTFPWRTGWAADFDPRVRDWYTLPVETRNVAWTGPYVSKSTNRLLITCSMPVIAVDDSIIGVIKMDVTPQTINDSIINIRVGQGGYAFLLDAEGTVVASPRIEDLEKMTVPAATVVKTKLDQALRAPATDKSVNLRLSTDPDLRRIAERMLKKERGLVRCNLDIHKDGSEDYIAYAPVSATGWSVGLIMPISEILSPAEATARELSGAANTSSAHIDAQITYSLWLMAMLLVVLLLMASWAAMALSRRITRPIQVLSDGASNLGAGKLDQQIVLKTGDEIEQLANDFNAMTTNLQTYIEHLGQATVARELVAKELQIAQKIQSSLLPRIFPPFPDRKEMELFASMDPAREVGGDFFDFFFIDQDRLCLAIGDVSDKGVPASLFMAVTKTLIKTEATQPDRSVADVLARVNVQLCEENEMLMFVTVFCVFINLKTGEMEYANAGHNPPMIRRADGDAQYLKVNKGVALAVMDMARYKVQKEVLKPGDLLYIYTDGVNEAMNMQREQFSYDRLKRCIDEFGGESTTTICTEMRQAVQIFAGEAPQSDDITMIAMRYHGPA
ncbi:hypothetical protein LBMAG53_17320 [Planctomycetota bacterium]|nr:hypothetical protein LBMAG53_17320 [Planctomycetota bacterium]